MIKLPSRMTHATVSPKLYDILMLETKLKMLPKIDYGGIADWVRDGFCDDSNNNEACTFDGGDCCGLSTKKNFCVNCACKCDSNIFHVF